MWSALREAIGAVPEVKYALGALGFTAAGGIALGLFLGNPVTATVATVAAFGFGVVLLAFVALSRVKPKEFTAPARILLWTIVLLFCVSTVLLISSFFFGWPLPFKPSAKTAAAGIVGPNIAGTWEYSCRAMDTKYSHGGTATIEMRDSTYGPQWQLTGERRWRERDGGHEEGINFHWETNWAAFTEQDRLKYTYDIQTDRGAVLGYADGSITEWKDGKPSVIRGRFYQLPPLDPMYGTYEFIRK
jgi:hypothetical protein